MGVKVYKWLLKMGVKVQKWLITMINDNGGEGVKMVKFVNKVYCKQNENECFFDVEFKVNGTTRLELGNLHPLMFALASLDSVLVCVLVR